MKINLIYFEPKPTQWYLNPLLSKASFGRRKWNGIKGIFLEYSSLLLFGSFNEGNGRFIPLFGSLSMREWNEQEETLIPLYSLKTSSFHSPPKLGGMGKNEIRFNDFFTKTPKIPLYIQSFILK